MLGILKKFATNSKKSNRVMLQCRTVVKKESVTRKSIDGVEHIIVSSSTLPDDIVMNGGLYPAEEIAKSFGSLELTLAPIEHPCVDGQFISANDPRAIHEFHAGAFNMNVRRENGRVHIDKFINVAEAMKTDRGKRLLDRIEELETNDSPRPIHTSVGVFVMPEELAEPQTNDAGDKITWIARDMVFDHDAILLDSVGAAQPHQGVGVAVNKDGQKLKVQQADIDPEINKIITEGFDRLSVLASNQEGMSFQEVKQAVDEALERSAIDSDWIEELFSDKVIFWSNDQLFEVPFIMDEQGLATIVGIPLPVERNVTFSPKTNHTEGDAMKDLILNALATAGVDTEGMNDDALFDAYNKLQVNEDTVDDGATDDDTSIAAVVANALKPLTEKIDGLQVKINSADEAEIDKLAGLVANSGKYPALDADSAKLLGVDKLKEMAANCVSAFGVSPVINADADDSRSAPAEMPK